MEGEKEDRGAEARQGGNESYGHGDRGMGVRVRERRSPISRRVEGEGGRAVRRAGRRGARKRIWLGASKIEERRSVSRWLLGGFASSEGRQPRREGEGSRIVVPAQGREREGGTGSDRCPIAHVDSLYGAAEGRRRRR
ncbi:hypothetical protein KM043_008530 [Ampulex compressa]|nr:hypothetical protein KM043_008530 [Ampulex compressa]